MGIMPISDWRTPASRIPEQSVSSCHVVKKIIKEGDALPMAGVFGYDQALFAEDTTITVLRCGEREAMDERSVWMSDSPQELYSMWELVARSEGPRVLVGGLGLGLLPNLLALRRDVNEVVVVENNPSIISMIRPHLNKKVKVIEGDFLEQMRELGRKGERFETVVSDIYKTPKSEEDRALFEDVQMGMEDDFIDARHLHWGFQKQSDEDTAKLILLARKR